MLPWVGIGGTLLFISGMLYMVNLALTLWASRQPAPAVPEFAEAISGPEDGPAFLDRLRPWLAVAVVMLMIAYGPTLARLVFHRLPQRAGLPECGEGERRAG